MNKKQILLSSMETCSPMLQYLENSGTCHAHGYNYCY